MAREINAELLDTKIEKAQQDLVKAKHRYDAATATLKDLLDKRDTLLQKKLLDAIAQSGRRDHSTAEKHGNQKNHVKKFSSDKFFFRHRIRC